MKNILGTLPKTPRRIEKLWSRREKDSKVFSFAKNQIYQFGNC